MTIDNDSVLQTSKTMFVICNKWLIIDNDSVLQTSKTQSNDHRHLTIIYNNIFLQTFKTIDVFIVPLYLTMILSTLLAILTHNHYANLINAFAIKYIVNSIETLEINTSPLNIFPIIYFIVTD